MLSLAIIAVALATRAAAHGGVLSYSIGSTWYKGFVPYNTPTGQVSIQREWDTYNPIQDATDPTVACNNAGASLSGSSQLTATIAAGSKITAYWNNPWPHPYGPMLVYLANCGGSTCNGVDSSKLKWFKIDQSGLVSGTVASGTWGSGLMIQQNNSWTTTIPSSVPNGNYLIRFETIALHSLPAQLYPECAQLQITGGGSRAPTAAELVTFPGAYSNSDPGLTVDLYGNAAKTQTTYVIPGPPLYGSSSSGGSPPPSSQSQQGPTSTAAPPPSTAAPPAPTATATVAKYGQCGGQGYTGPTTCVAGTKCTKSNDYYSQCL